MKIKRALGSKMMAGTIAACMMAMISNPASAKAESSADRISQALVSAKVAEQNTGANITTASKIDLHSDRPAVSVTAEGKGVSLSLETANAAGQAEPSGDARAFGDVAPDTDTLVREVDGSAQILAVMRTASAPTTQRYRAEVPVGTKLVPFGQAFNLVEEDGQVVGQIAAPWAKDATGRSLPTTYTLDGTTLVQQTDTTGAKFPVVADPKLTYGFGIYINLWGHEARSAAIAIVALGGVTFVTACTATSKIPNPILKTIATLICGAAAVNLTKVWQAILSISRSTAWVNTGCYQQKVYPLLMSSMVKVSAKNCL